MAGERDPITGDVQNEINDIIFGNNCGTGRTSHGKDNHYGTYNILDCVYQRLVVEAD
jgi:hypothetical protein